MSKFQDTFDKQNWDKTLTSIFDKTASDVLRALNTEKRDLEDFKALISPAALPYLEEMAQISRQLTKKRFGNSVRPFKSSSKHTKR